MKKLFKVAIVLGMILCLTVTAFAATVPGNSPTATGGEVTNVVDKAGNSVKIEVSAPTEHFIPVEIGEEIDFGDGEEVKAKDLTVVYEQDLTSEVLPVTITFEVPGAGPNDILHVMHYNGSNWEQVAQAKGDCVSATFTSLSPVAVVLQTVEPTQSDPGTNPGPGTESGPTSPQTGADMTMTYVAIAVALMAGTVAIVAKKKHA